MLQLFSNQKKAGQRTKAVVDPSTVVVVVKVSKFPNEPKIVRISTLYFGTVQGRKSLQYLVHILGETTTS